MEKEQLQQQKTRSKRTLNSANKTYNCETFAMQSFDAPALMAIKKQNKKCKTFNIKFIISIIYFLSHKLLI